MTKKQEREIKIIEWFVNPGWGSSVSNDYLIGIENITESDTGISPEDAFFMKSEKGKLPEVVNNKKRLRLLMWGKVWREGYLLPGDFEDEPDYIREFVYPRVFGLPKDWKSG